MSNFDVVFYLPTTDQRCVGAVDRVIYALAALPQRGTADEVASALRFAAARMRDGACALDDAAAHVHVEPPP